MSRTFDVTEWPSKARWFNTWHDAVDYARENRVNDAFPLNEVDTLSVPVLEYGDKFSTRKVFLLKVSFVAPRTPIYLK